MRAKRRINYCCSYTLSFQSPQFPQELKTSHLAKQRSYQKRLPLLIFHKRQVNKSVRMI